MKWRNGFAGAFLIVLIFMGVGSDLRGQDASKPNIVLIFVDDLGYGDLGCYGGRLVPTPNIDRLAAEGVRCTDGYASAATCAPSRLGLMSGRYQQRMGAYSNRTSPTAKIPGDHSLMPRMLKEAGYRTALIGKWHIARPARSVFDEVHHEIRGASDYFPGPDGVLTGKLSQPMQHGWSSERGKPYITDAHGDAAVSFIRKQSESNDPFFLYLAFNAPHAPWQAPLELKEKFSHLKPEVIQLYAAMIHSLDQNVGRVLRQIEESNVEEKTLILFISDNGPEWGRNYPALNWPAEWDSTIVGSAGPLSGRKAEFLEGGIRVPFILRWPGVLKAGDTYRRPVSTLDLYETFRVLAKGIKVQTDGLDLLPYLSGKTRSAPHPVLFWQGGEAAPIYARSGPWKLAAPRDSGRPRLYDLRHDIGEKRDVSMDNPKKVKELLLEVEKWNTSIKASQR